MIEGYELISARVFLMYGIGLIKSIDGEIRVLVLIEVSWIIQEGAEEVVVEEDEVIGEGVEVQAVDIILVHEINQVRIVLIVIINNKINHHPDIMIEIEKSLDLTTSIEGYKTLSQPIILKVMITRKDRIPISVVALPEVEAEMIILERIGGEGNTVGLEVTRQITVDREKVRSITSTGERTVLDIERGVGVMIERENINIRNTGTEGVMKMMRDDMIENIIGMTTVADQGK